MGKDALAEGDKITLEVARLLKDDYLQQNSFTKYDKYCPFYKSVWMLRNITLFHTLSTAAVERPANSEGQKLTFGTIRARLADLMYKITSQKFEDPADGEATLKARFAALHDAITAAFKGLEEEYR